MSEKPFRILAIDGGGIRGIFSAFILECLVKRLNIAPSEKFDMIAGTSTGSIIAAAVASDISPSQIVKLYMELGSKIFDKGLWARLERLKFLVKSRYCNQQLAKAISDVFGEKKLGEIKKPLLIPATDLGNGGVHVFKSGYSKDFTRDKEVLLKDAVLASCSAPTYFDPVKVQKYMLADGGLWANNPSLCAVIDAKRRLGIEVSSIQVLSLGTGQSKTRYGVVEGQRWGFVNGWRGSTFIDFLMSLQAQSTENYLQLLLRPDQIIRLNFETDSPLPMDDVEAIDDLLTKADKVFTHSSEKLQTMLAV